MGVDHTTQHEDEQFPDNEELLDATEYANDIGFPNVMPEDVNFSEEEPSGEYSEEE